MKITTFFAFHAILPATLTAICITTKNRFFGLKAFTFLRQKLSSDKKIPRDSGFLKKSSRGATFNLVIFLLEFFRIYPDFTII